MAIWQITHGHTCNDSETPEYGSWRSMRRRCEEPGYKTYKTHGARGITFCARWAIFENFLADMGARPEGTTLDRIDNDGNYEPGNCRWATPKQQVRNGRRATLTTDSVSEIKAKLLQGETQRALAEEFGVSQDAIWKIANGRTWADIT